MQRYLIFISVYLIVGCSSESQGTLHDNPYEKFIDVSGKIENEIKYKISVQYSTHSEELSCTVYNFKVGKRVPKFRSFDYFPDIKDKSHSVHIPLKALTPDIECNWLPVNIFLCISPADKEGTFSSCSSIYGLKDNKIYANPITTVSCSKSGFCFGGYDSNWIEDGLNKGYTLNINKK